MKTAEEMILSAKLHRKQVEIGAKIGQMKDDGFNKHSGYGFISSNGMLGRCRVLFETFQFSITPCIIKCTESSFQSAGDKTVIRTVLEMLMIVTDTETGYSESIPWYACDQDTGGKSFGKAVTEGQKRFYFKFFNVSTMADFDSDYTTVEIESVDPVEFCGKHPELVELCKQKHPKRSDLKAICEKNNFNVEEVKKALEKFGGVA